MSHLDVILTEIYIYMFYSCLGCNIIELYGVFCPSIWLFNFLLAWKSKHLWAAAVSCKSFRVFEGILITQNYSFIGFTLTHCGFEM